MSTSAQRRAARNARRLKGLKRDDKMAYEKAKRDIRIRDTNELNRHKDQVAAHAIQVGSREAVAGVYEKARTDAARDNETIEKSAGSIEKNILTEPRTIMTGAAHAVAEPIPVGHWRAQMPAALAARLGLPRMASSAYVLLAQLPAGGGRVDFVGDVLVAEQPELTHDGEFYDWALGAAKLFTADLAPALTLLINLRNVEWWSETCDAAGVNIKTTEQVQRRGKFCGVVSQPVTTVNVPSLARVQVTDEGLELVFEPRPGDTPERWGKAIPVFRTTFKTLKVDADALSVRESGKGEIILCFNNAKSSFPVAVTPPTPYLIQSEAEAVAAYPDLAWEFGVDARGNILRSRVADSPHVALIAQTGWGKSVLSASIVEQMRCSGAMIMLFDGKGTDHPRHLGRQPGVIWLSKEPAAHAVGMAWVHAEMEDRYALVDEENDGPDTTKSFAFPPIFVLIDELPSLRGAMADADKKDKGSTFDWMMQDLLQKGRQCRIHLLVVSQSLYVASLPAKMQTNITRTIFLGPVDSRSLMSDDISEEAKEQVVRLSSRIPESAKGRAVFMARGDGGTVVRQFQSFYGYSPGNTALDAAPTPEVREAWAEAKGVSEQMPMLYDRIGIRVDGPDWRDLSMAELVELPTVIVADGDGPISGMEKYDPLAPEFTGAAKVGSRGNRARGRGAAGHGVTSEPDPSAEEVPTPTEPDVADILAALTPEQRAALVAAAAEQSKPTEVAPKPRTARTKTARTPKPPKATKPADDNDMEFA